CLRMCPDGGRHWSSSIMKLLLRCHCASRTNGLIAPSARGGRPPSCRPRYSTVPRSSRRRRSIDATALGAAAPSAHLLHASQRCRRGYCLMMNLKYQKGGYPPPTCRGRHPYHDDACIPAERRSVCAATVLFSVPRRCPPCGCAFWQRLPSTNLV